MVMIKKQSQYYDCFYYLMVGKTGFEPATPWSQTRCSTKLNYFPRNGAPSRSWTRNLLIRSQMLYPIELWAQNQMVASGGIEPPTQGFSVLCSTDWATKPKKWRFRPDSDRRSSAWQADVITTTPRNQLVAEDGFEPTTFGLWAQRATRLLHSAI